MYFAQLNELCRLSSHSIRQVAVEGDSTDQTRTQLKEYATDYGLDLDLRTKSHGGPVYGSTEAPERFTALSGVANEVFAGVRESDDVFVYVESDLIWRPEILLRLASRLVHGVDVLAPMVFAGEHFYDLWAFRINGHRFSPTAPYYSGLRNDGPTKIDSAGSCLVMKAHVARETPPMTTGALVEWCGNARAKGFGIYVDARERIHHP
jgi:hypothetical protein